MDLQPELSIASGLIKEGSLSANVLTRMGNYIIRSSDFILTLDKYMKDYLLRREAIANSIYTLPIWPAMEKVYAGKRLENSFRLEKGFGDRIVVMYSGNHSFVHPLDTLLQAAYNLRNDKNFLFVFIGGGVRKKDVTQFKEKHAMENILQLPYEPRENIHNSLGAADIQVVIMGDGQVGYTHPNKIYGAMFVGKPVLYIGPSPSHITDILDQLKGNIKVMHGEADSLTSQLSCFGELSEEEKMAVGELNRQFANEHFYPDLLKKQLAAVLEKEMKERQE
jgi:glycosyltransferase involved in cell wall biosynthesis